VDKGCRAKRNFYRLVRTGFHLDKRRLDWNALISFTQLRFVDLPDGVTR
jgi:hypothetical protein